MPRMLLLKKKLRSYVYMCALEITLNDMIFDIRIVTDIS